MPQDLGAGTAKYISATGTVAITSAAGRLLGFIQHGTATNGITLWNCKSSASATATYALSDVIYAYGTTGAATVNPAVWMPFPAVFNNGLVVDVLGSADPNVTLFYVAG